MSSQSWADMADEEYMDAPAPAPLPTPAKITPPPGLNAAPSAAAAPVEKTITPTWTEDQLPTKAPFKIYAQNIAWSAQPADFENFFKPLKVSEVYLPLDYESKKPKGTAYISFQSCEDLVAGLQRHGQSFLGREVVLYIARPPTAKEDGGRPPRDKQFNKGGNRNNFGRQDKGNANANSGDNSEQKQERRPRTDRFPVRSAAAAAAPAPAAAAGDAVDAVTSPTSSKVKSDPFAGAKPREEVLSTRPDVPADKPATAAAAVASSSSASSAAASSSSSGSAPRPSSSKSHEHKDKNHESRGNWNKRDKDNKDGGKREEREFRRRDDKKPAAAAAPAPAASAAAPTAAKKPAVKKEAPKVKAPVNPFSLLENEDD